MEVLAGVGGYTIAVKPHPTMSNHIQRCRSSPSLFFLAAVRGQPSVSII